MDEDIRNDKIDKVVAANLRRLRTGRDWTQTQLADALQPLTGVKITAAAVSQWEDDTPKDDKLVRRFSITELRAICQVFDVNLSTLLLPGLGFVFYGVDAPDDYFAVWDDCFSGINDDDGDRWQGSLVKIRNRAGVEEVGLIETIVAGLAEQFTTEQLKAALQHQTEGES